MEVDGVMMNVVSGYVPQVGSEPREKEKFCGEMDEVNQGIPQGKRVVIGADFYGL